MQADSREAPPLLGSGSTRTAWDRPGYSAFNCKSQRLIFPRLGSWFLPHPPLCPGCYHSSHLANIEVGAFIYPSVLSPPPFFSKPFYSSPVGPFGLSHHFEIWPPWRWVLLHLTLVPSRGPMVKPSVLPWPLLPNTEPAPGLSVPSPQLPGCQGGPHPVHLLSRSPETWEVLFFSGPLPGFVFWVDVKSTRQAEPTWNLPLPGKVSRSDPLTSAHFCIPTISLVESASRWSVAALHRTVPGGVGSSGKEARHSCSRAPEAPWVASCRRRRPCAPRLLTWPSQKLVWTPFHPVV